MPSKYKLTYFPISGRAEPIRFLLSYGNREFDDYRIKYEDWPKIKPTMPFGVTPVLEIDGVELHQTTAICRYLAKQMNLNGKDDQEALQIDIVVDTLNDLLPHIADYYYDPNETTKAPKHEPLLKKTIPFFMSHFDKIACDNNGYFVGGHLTWADFYVISLGDYLGKLAGVDMFEGYPNIQRVKQNVVNIPQIKAWIERRPEENLYKHPK